MDFFFLEKKEFVLVQMYVSKVQAVQNHIMHSLNNLLVLWVHVWNLRFL